MKELGRVLVLRLEKIKDRPVITDNGNFVIDVDFVVIEDHNALSKKLNRIPGVIEHGIFDNLDELHVASFCQVEIIRRKGSEETACCYCFHKMRAHFISCRRPRSGRSLSKTEALVLIRSPIIRDAHVERYII